MPSATGNHAPSMNFTAFADNSAISIVRNRMPSGQMMRGEIRHFCAARMINRMVSISMLPVTDTP